jgi:hypothetical protein
MRFSCCKSNLSSSLTSFFFGTLAFFFFFLPFAGGAPALFAEISSCEFSVL